MSATRWRRVGASAAVARRGRRLVAARRPRSAPAPAGAATPTQGRVLVISLPDVEWADFDRGAARPNLDRLFAASAVGAMVTNGVDRPDVAAERLRDPRARARAPSRNGSTGGQGFGVDEDFGRDPAGVVFTTRTGIPPGDGLVYMPIADTIDEQRQRALRRRGRAARRRAGARRASRAP